MIWLEASVALMIICFSGVLLFGAPYVPTLQPQVRTALELVDLKPGQTLLELGCGDGKVLIAAAKQGINVVGYELNPLLATIAWLRTRRYRRHVKVIWGNFWRKPWPPAEAAFTFLLPKYMEKLNKKVIQYEHKPVKLVSFAFQIPGKRPTSQKNSIYLYTYH
jgi:SAM-dependent methyltransferase